MEAKSFYSWQSDSKAAANRTLIQDGVLDEKMSVEAYVHGLRLSPIKRPFREFQEF